MDSLVIFNNYSSIVQRRGYDVFNTMVEYYKSINAYLSYDHFSGQILKDYAEISCKEEDDKDSGQSVVAPPRSSPIIDHIHPAHGSGSPSSRFLPTAPLASYSKSLVTPYGSIPTPWWDMCI
ncbi:hypothetical protein MMC32_001713 [Xylographa parallela]|nr:hypothetical protein [Xylographa parallela]